MIPTKFLPIDLSFLTSIFSVNMPTPIKNVVITNISYGGSRPDGNTRVTVDTRTNTKSLIVLDWISRQDFGKIINVRRIQVPDDMNTTSSHKGADIILDFEERLQARVFAMIFDPESVDHTKLSV